VQINETASRNLSYFSI